MAKGDMKLILGCLRRADDRFGLIEDGDKIAVGVSGGKDSTLLLYALSLYRRFRKKDFAIFAVTVSLGIEPFDTAPIAELCRKLNIPYEVVPSDIGNIVFKYRNEHNPCSLCANMRRGTLNTAAKRLGCNKVALAHHGDDAVETLLMSMFYEGRLNTFLPQTYLSHKDLTVIRPFVFLREESIISAVKRLALPIVESPCPINGKTVRNEMKVLLNTLEQTVPDVRARLLGALDNTAQYNLWDEHSCAVGKSHDAVPENEETAP